MTPRARRLAAPVAAFLLGLVALGAAAYLTLAPGPRQAAASSVGGPFRLTAGDGRTVTDQDLRGAPFLVFFGFTHCPDICPTKLFELSEVFKALGDKAGRLKAYFITVDPERDTPAVMNQYVQSFDPRIVGLTGDPEAIASAVRQYRAFARKVPLKDGDYTMEHTALVYIMDGSAASSAPSISTALRWRRPGSWRASSDEPGPRGAGEAVLGLVPALRGRRQSSNRPRQAASADEQVIEPAWHERRSGAEPTTTPAAPERREGRKGHGQHIRLTPEMRRRARDGRRSRPGVRGLAATEPLGDVPARDHQGEDRDRGGLSATVPSDRAVTAAEEAGRSRGPAEVEQRPARMGDRDLKEPLHPARALTDPRGADVRGASSKVVGRQIGDPVAGGREPHAEIGILRHVPGIPAAERPTGPRGLQEMVRGAAERNRQVEARASGRIEHVEQSRVIGREAAGEPGVVPCCRSTSRAWRQATSGGRAREESRPRGATAPDRERPRHRR